MNIEQVMQDRQEELNPVYAFELSFARLGDAKEVALSPDVEAVV